MPSSFSSADKILFISDVHYGAFSKAKNRQLETELIKLINFAEQENYRIAVLGDLFDYWIEYPSHVPSFGDAILRRFQKFHKNAPASLYITGNHDNWTLGHFEEIGFDVEPDYRILHMQDSQILLVHGDAIGKSINELERPLFHRIIRDETFLKIYRALLPPRAGLSVMKGFSKLSRKFGDEGSDPETLNNWARRLLKDSKIDFVFCGHDHRPRRLKFNYGTYINLGTFHHHQTLVEYNNEHFSLVQWNSNSRKLHPFQPQTLAHE